MANFIAFTVYDDEGHEIQHFLPARYEVCSRCEGEGKHVNPAIDGNGITASEWAEWDDEERHNYRTGVYDVTCEECNGRTTVLEVDEDKADEDILALYREEQEDEAYYEGICRMERMMGA